MAEELDLHLLKLPAAKGVIARVDLVAKRLANLSDSERQFEPRTIEDVVEVDENALSGFGAQKRLAFLKLIENALNVILQSTCFLFLIQCCAEFLREVERADRCPQHQV